MLPVQGGRAPGRRPQVAAFLETGLGYPLSEGSGLLGERVAAFYRAPSPKTSPWSTGLEGRPPVALVAARARRPLGGDAPELDAGLGPGADCSGRVDTSCCGAARPLGPRTTRACAGGGHEEDARSARFRPQQSLGPFSIAGEMDGVVAGPVALSPRTSPTRSIGAPSSRDRHAHSELLGTPERVGDRRPLQGCGCLACASARPSARRPS